MIINGDSLLMASPIKNMEKYKKKLHGVSYGLGEAGYDIRLKQKLEFVAGGNPYIIIDGDNKTLSERERFRWGRFVLASAMEEFIMPPNLVGIVHDKSSWARQGISVFNTVIEPGWKGFLTLEIVFHGGSNIVIPAGAGIAQVIFHETSDDTSYEGKYQDQKDNPVPSKWEG